MESHSATHIPLGRAAGALTCFVFGLTSFFGSIFIHGPVLPIMCLWPWLYRRLAEIAAAMWQALIVATLEKIFGVKVVITGDTIRRHEKTLVIMNHRTRLDWMFFFCCVFHCRVLNRHKITLKSVLKWIPGAGWGMQACGYIFLDRKWESDKVHITNMLNHCVALKAYPNYLFFPEGTDFSENSKASSDRFAEKNNLQKYQYVIHPRTTGFIHMVNTLRQVGELQAVHDVTVAYPKSLVQAETRLFHGEVPEEVHFHIKRYNIAELPVDEEGLTEWCQQRWEEKEEMLRSYYTDVTDEESKDIKHKCANRHFPNDKVPPLSDRGFLLWFCIAAWLTFLVVSITAVVLYPVARFYMFAIIAFHIVQWYYVGGVEKLEMLVYKMLQEWRGVGTIAVDKSKTEKANPYDKFLKTE